MSATEFGAILDALDAKQAEAADALGIDPRTLRRYLSGELPVRGPLLVLLRLAVWRGITAETLKQTGERTWLA